MDTIYSALLVIIVPLTLLGVLASGPLLTLIRVPQEAYEQARTYCMVVLGGMGHVPGVVAGALLLSIFPEVLRNVVVPIQQTLFGEVLVDPDAIRMLLFGVALVAVMIFRPEGLWPSQVRKREVKSVKEQQA